jgi:hypothetical protein
MFVAVVVGLTLRFGGGAGLFLRKARRLRFPSGQASVSGRSQHSHQAEAMLRVREASSAAEIDSLTICWNKSA